MEEVIACTMVAVVNVHNKQPVHEFCYVCDPENETLLQYQHR